MYLSSVSLPPRFVAHLEARRLFREPGLALLAVSGGPDSLALLDLMATLPGRRVELCVVHVDHGIHPESARVASRVAELARSRYGLETVTGRLDLGPGAGETTARAARYEFLREIQHERGGRWLVTAHHADDQAETVLLRLLKGSAPAGLAGIPERGPRGLVRPLLSFTRDELAAHVAALGLSPFMDPANADERHDRSWLRERVLPVLAARLGDRARASLVQVASHAHRELRAWDAVLEALPGLDVKVENGFVSVARGPLHHYDKALAGRILRAAARRAGIRVGPRLAERLAAFASQAESGRRMDVGEHVVAEIAFDRLLIGSSSPTPDSRHLTPSSGALRFGSFALRWQPDRAPERLSRDGWTTWIAPNGIAVRAPESGDRLVPLYGMGRREVTKLLMEARVARRDRAGWPVLVKGTEPIWVPGVCRGAAALPEPGTNALRVDVTAG